ncbi:UDP-N-acetylmuramate dehydrogenase [Consotaella aegiceratis]|uniref:UDP-N-acetylmuramate dehydrogenase n=1 Tax=Consotaella aegiceratis TaxID=3097961 RepID=UPI002F427843
MDVISDYDLTGHNTFGLASRAEFGAIVAERGDVAELAEFAASRDLPLRIVGGGSNLLLRERIDGVVGLMATRGKTIAERQDGQILVTAQAGEDWPAFVEWSVGQGLGGLENLAGIPGTVGAAPVQNIGAYGVELKDRFRALTAYDLVDRQERVFEPGECGFSYRQSVFKSTGRFVILDVTLALPEPWRPILDYRGLDDLPAGVDARAVMERVIAVRRSKLPDWRVLGNAGSFFHNPVVSLETAERIDGVPRYPQADGRVKLSAAWLIDACGLKGLRQGRAGVHDGHALILVNHGHATYDEVSGLAARIQATVRERFGVDLVQEPITV